MGRGKGWIIIALLISFLLLTRAQDTSACPGQIFNPITDVDWMGVFPIKIGGVTVASFGQEDTDTVGVNPSGSHREYRDPRWRKNQPPGTFACLQTHRHSG